MPIKAVIFDYIGTLVNCKGYSMDASRKTLYNALVAGGFKMEEDKFLAAYTVTHEKYRKVRYEQFREVTNAIWVSEALCNLGFEVSPKDTRVMAALNVFFREFIDTFELRDNAKKLLEQTTAQTKVGLISNFTYAPVIHSSLRKIRIHPYFNAVVVSEENGWRKPSPHIFRDALKRLQVEAHEAVFIGDSPVEDIKGAKDTGLKTVFVTSQFNNQKDLKESKLKPDYTAKDLTTISMILNQILSSK
jgi:HAD superfamily hydrolase (TIGR01549 family)